MMDPPDHTRMRGLVSKAFTPGMVRRLRPRIETITADLIAALPDEADLVRDFAYPLPVMVISEMLGVAGGGPRALPRLERDHGAQPRPDRHRRADRALTTPPARVPRLLPGSHRAAAGAA
ncbi:hypothetical protein ACFSTC_61190 [Nonomuraea ferruginea]